MPRHQTNQTDPASEQRPSATIIVLNLPVPDDRRVWAEAEALRDDGVDVTVICPALRGKAPGRRAVAGIGVVYFRSFEGSGRLATVLEGVWNTATASRLARRALRGARAVAGGGPRPRAMLQVCNPPDSLYRLLRWARRKGVLTVYDQHDVVPVLADSKPAFRRLLPVLTRLERRTVEEARVVLTPSHEQVERLQALFGRRAFVVRTAPVVASAIRAADTGRLDGTVRVGYLGVIGEQDGVDELIEAVGELRARGVDGFEVEIAGDGPSLSRVRDRAAQLGVGDTVRFRGWLVGDEVDAFLDGVDVMVVPDPDIPFNHYCAMNKVTHAMARGLPVVLRPLRENLNLVRGNGLVAADMSLAAFADAIAAFLALGAEERASLGQRLRAVYDRGLSWDFFKPIYLDAVSPARTAPGRDQDDLTAISDLTSPDTVSDRNSDSGK